MLKTIETYLALRRATGYAMLNTEYLLKSFAAFATERGQTHVHTQTAIDWAARGPSAAQRDARLKAVCRFVRHVQVEDARHELPPVNHFGAHKARRSPHIYSAVEINHLIAAALRLRPKGGLRSLTYATLIALLSATGLRISEALHLTLADVDARSGTLRIRDSKNGESRTVPVTSRLTATLAGYIAAAHPGPETTDHVFYSVAPGRPISQPTATVPNTGTMMSRMTFMVFRWARATPVARSYPFCPARALAPQKALPPASACECAYAAIARLL